MSWSDRLTDMVYTSPSGKIFTGIYENVSKDIIKKTTAFTFPDVSGTYVQDLGNSGRQYPMRWIFSGVDYDKDAEEFDTAIEEKGPGILQHPFYGTFDVVPFGTIKRRDDLVTAGNQAIYDIIFYQTIKIVFPISELNAENAIKDDIQDASENLATQYDQDVSVETAPETTGLIDSMKAGLRKIKKAMAKVAAETAAVERAFNDLASIADETISTLVGGPLLIATQLIALSRLPAKTAASIQSKLDAYGNLLASLTEGTDNQFEQGNDSQAGNAYLTNNMIAASAFLGSIESTITSGVDAVVPLDIFTTRTDIINTTENIDSKLNDYITWSDRNRENLVIAALPTREPGTSDLIDTGEPYQKLLGSFAICQGRLTQIAFTALQERSVILDRDRTFIDFCAEFYGELDGKYDFMIQTNRLSGSEIIELPKGKTMVYYV